jgi:hypothetical protein
MHPDKDSPDLQSSHPLWRGIGRVWTSGLVSRHALPALALFLVSLQAFGAANNDGYGEYTIRRSDIPKDAPRFEDFPAKRYAGPNAAPDVRTEPRSRIYRTQLKGWATEKPNFAGHYILATWGCGTGCTQIAVIDALTGKVFHPPGARTNSIVDVHDELLVDEGSSPRRADFGALRYSADSRLLILIGTPEDRAANRGISYFVWDNDALKRIRFVPKAGYSGK